jgi:hypothetical protein
MTMDTQFSGVIPLQWTKLDASEFHDVMDKLKTTGFKAIA